MKCNLLIILTLTCAAFFSGCSWSRSGKFNLENRQITILTEPAGAHVTQLRPLDQSSIDLGLTPLNDQTVSVLSQISMRNMPFNEAQNLMRHQNNVVVRIKKDGFETYNGTLTTDPNKTTIHNITLHPKN